MKFDTIIIGGGLAGLTCGIRLQSQGKKCAIVSAGQSALHFSSGSFDLLNRLPDGTKVVSPLASVQALSESHPYTKMQSRFAQLAEEAKALLEDSGVPVSGSADKNSYRITPMGTLKPTWLTMADFTTLPTDTATIGKNILVVNFLGFLDFNTKFIADAFESNGAKCDIKAVSMPVLEKLRHSATEMRAPNIARVFDDEVNFEAFVTIVKGYIQGHDCVVLPAIFGLNSSMAATVLGQKLNVPVCLMPTMPPSVPGIRTQQQLRRRFQKLGGIYMLGDTVLKADIANSKINAIYTANHVEEPLVADNYILASGSFFSKGLVATPENVYEPIFGLDVDFAGNRAEWYASEFFEPQQYMTFGVKTDNDFATYRNGAKMENLYAIGSVLSGFNPMTEGCGAGVAMTSAIFVADNLKNC